MQRLSSRLVLGLILVTTISLGALQHSKWQSFGYNGLDLAIYTNTVHSLAHGQGFASTIHDPSYLGDHLELGLLPVAALYRLAPSGLTLLWIQTLLITGSAWFVWLFLRRLLGTKAGLIGVVLWLLHPLVYNVALYEFHGLVFAWPLIWWSILAYQQNRLRQWWVAIGLLCLVREDMPLLAVGWGLLALIERRGWRWWAPAFVVGAAWFIVAQQIIASANPAGAYKYLVFYRWAGTTPGEIVSMPFRHPLVFLAHIFQPNNWQTVLGLLLAVGGLAVFRWRRCLPVIFLLAQLLLLGTQAESILHLHYVIPYLPFLIWAAAETWQAVRARQLWRRLDPQIAVALATILVVVGPVYAHLLYGPIELPWTPRTDAGASPVPILRAAVAAVRPNDRVLTTFNLLPALASRPTIYSLNYLYLGRRQYTEDAYVIPTDIDVAVIDWQQLYTYQFIYRDTLYHGRTGAERLNDTLREQGLSLASWHDSVAVYRRGGTDDFQPTTRNTVGQIGGQKFGPVTALGAPHVNTIVSQELDGQPYQTIPVLLQWYVHEKITQPVSLRFTLQQNDRDIWSSTRLLGQGVYPAIDWPLGSAWTTRYFLSVPAAMSGPAQLRVEIVELTGRYRLNRVRAFSPVIRREKMLGQLPLGTITLLSDSQ